MLQLMACGMTGITGTRVQYLAAMVPKRGQGLATILHLLLVGRRAREHIRIHKYAALITVQVKLCGFLFGDAKRYFEFLE